MAFRHIAASIRESSAEFHSLWAYFTLRARRAQGRLTASHRAPLQGARHGKHAQQMVWARAMASCMVQPIKEKGTA
jgi:hypothetical protein